MGLASIGYFDKDGKEYVITQPNTPRPWYHYLSNHVYHAILSHTGGGYSYYKDCKLHRILNYIDQRSDRPGRYIYIRENETKDFWTPQWQPLCKDLDSWRMTYGFGYAVLKASNNNIETETTYFVPNDDPCEVWCFKIKNNSHTKKSLSIFPYVSFLLGDFYMEQNFKNILVLYNEGYFEQENNTLVAFKHPTSARPYETYGFLTSSEKVDGFEVDSEKFLGNYGYLCAPEAVKNNKVSNTPTRGKELVGVLKLDIELKPGEEKEMTFCLGFAEDKKEIQKLVKKYHNLQTTQKELKEVKQIWQKRLGVCHVETPDSEFDLMNNYWGKYQLIQVTQWRSAAPYNPGEGGRGFRDTAQDTEAFCALDSAQAKEKIKMLLQNQYETGHAVAGFSEIEGPWEMGSSTGILGKGDVAVWIPYLVTAYLKETGDFDFLKEKISYLRGKEATVWEHCVQAMEHFKGAVGPHGLPLFWKADWNDAFDRCGIKGKGESIWLGMAYVRALRQMEELSFYLKRNKWAKRFKREAEKSAKILNDKAWDGDWYISLFTDEGKIIGSHKNKEGKIYLNPQSWAILADVCDEWRQKKLLTAVEKNLETEFGPYLFSPSYKKYDPTIGRITAFAPGTKENAAIFSHACAFMIVAYAKAGLGNKAYELFKKITPFNPEKTLDIYKTEPYVYPEYVLGHDNREMGEGAFTWNTGTAAWMFMAAHQWILGIKPTYEGLMMDPVIPKNWKEFKVKRIFRGSVYHIHVKNPHGLEKGKPHITLNGKKLKGNIVPTPKQKKVFRVEVVLQK
ncbi:MAG: hypothetical protein HYW47_07360 [Deltaproteobacteria bacterium]|nr:hypothetical protein [Deltaproteobacteria bacterium]